MKDIQKWDKIAEKYSEAIEQDLFRKKFLYPLILKSLGQIKDNKILDAGCASGNFSRLLAKKGASVFGIDNSSRMIEIAQKKGKSKKVKYKVGDLGRKLDFQDNYFDLIVSVHTLMDLKNHQKALSEFARVLKPKGILVFSISHPCFTVPVRHWKKGVLGRISLKWAYIKISDYFKRQKIEKYLVNKNSPTSYYHRPLEDYLNSLIKAGFVIIDFQEPKMPSDLAKKTNFFLADKIPMVLIMKAKKP